VETVGVVLLLAVLLALAGALLMWRDRRRGAVCPHCGRPGTFGADGEAAVCGHCGFDFRSDDY
jgi:NADH pyrophosphatase NudC (nudix superfamily)